MNPKAKGEVSQGQILAALLRKGEIVLTPFGDNQRYDLVVERDGAFIRVQCKTGRVKRKGQILFDTCSSYVHRGRGKRDYRGEADIFAVYCPDTDCCYWVPVNECGTSTGCLRLEAPKNGQQANIRWAKDFEL